MKFFNLKSLTLILVFITGSSLTAAFDLPVRPAAAGLASGAVAALLAFPTAANAGILALIPWLGSPLLGGKIGGCKSKKDTTWLKACDTLGGAITFGSIFLLDPNLKHTQQKFLEILAVVLGVTAVKGAVNFGLYPADFTPQNSTQSN